MDKCLQMYQLLLAEHGNVGPLFQNRNILSKVWFVILALNIIMMISNQEYNDWFEKYKMNCLINHSGSSDSMESDGACQIFIWSIERFSLKYTTFVGDDDTGCYCKVCDRC